MRALNTAGRAVLFAGGTVCIALLGLLVLRLNMLNGLAYASVFAVGADHGGRYHALARPAGLHGYRACSAAGSGGAWPRDGPREGYRQRLLGALGAFRVPPPRRFWR